MCCPHHEPWTSSVSHSSKKVLEQSFTLTDTRPVNIVLSFEFETGSIRGVTFTPLSVYRQEIQRKFFSGRQHFQLLGNCLLVMQNHSSFAVYNHTKVCQKKRDYEALLPLQCIMRALFIVKNHITSKSKSNSWV